MKRLFPIFLAAAIALPAGSMPTRPVSGFSPTKEPVSPDGTRAIVELPADQHIKNVGGSDGAGLCVFTSVEHAARWQNVRELDGLQKYMRSRPGGGWPDKLDKVLAAHASEKGGKPPAYIQHTGGDDAFLDLALRTDRFPCVTYCGQDDFYATRIAHMVNLAHLDATRAAVVDNNRPGVWVWMTRAEFLSRWRGMSGGWAVVLLGPPPPPHADKPPQEFGTACICGDDCKCKAGECPGKCPVVVGQCANGKCAMPPPVAKPIAPATGDPRPIGNPPGPDFEWQSLPGIGWGWVQVARPAAPPVQAVPIDNFGVESGRIHQRPSYSINGIEVTRSAALAALGGAFPDDSDRWHLTAVGDAELIAKFKADVANLPIEVKDKLLVQSYGVSDWAVSTFRLPDGVCLRRPSPIRIGLEVGRIPADQYSIARLDALLSAAGGPVSRPVPPAPKSPQSPDEPVIIPQPDNPVPDGGNSGSVWLLILAAGAGLWWLFRRK